MKVFIGGSISIRYLDTKVVMLINKYMDQKFEILIGDAYGVDSLVQKQCFNRMYDKVKVYASNGYARNNIGAWTIKKVNVPSNIYGGDREFYAQKDIAMTSDCDFGLMIWNEKSRATLANIKRLIQYGKNCIVYFANKKTLKTITNYDELENI